MNLLKDLTTEMPIIFTAQSKAHFYCRDAVCEYALAQGVLPLNPFRVFEYFLGERVERDLVRRGNNNLIRVSDELWVFGQTIADGVLREILYAQDLGKPVRYFTIDSIASRIEPIPPGKLAFEQQVYGELKLRKDGLLMLLNGGKPALEEYPQGKLFD